MKPNELVEHLYLAPKDSLTFASKAGACLSGAPSSCSPSWVQILGQAEKVQLAYLALSLVMSKEIFITVTPGWG